MRVPAVTIHVDRSVAGRIRNSPENIILVVRDASDPEAAAVALKAAATEISNLDAGPRSAPGLSARDRNTPSYVSPVMPTGLGPMVSIDASSLPHKLAATIADVVVRHLSAAGVEHATVVAPAQGGAVTSMLWSNDGLERAVSLRLYPPPPMRWREFATIPDQWLAEAADWVNRAAEDDTVHARVVATEFPLQPEHTEAFLRQARDAHSPAVELVSGELGVRIAMAGGYFFGFEPNVSLSAGGPAANDEELVAVFEDLVAVARRLAPTLGYAFVSFDDRFTTGSAPTYEWWKLGGETPEALRDLCDEYVFDAFPYQMLSPGHIGRLGGIPETGGELQGGRVELTIGDPRQWLLEPREPMVFGYDPFLGRRRDPQVVEHGRRLLAACLLRHGDGARQGLLKARWARGDAIAREKTTTPPAGGTQRGGNR